MAKFDWKGTVDSQPASSTSVKAQQHARQADDVSWKGPKKSCGEPFSDPNKQTKVTLRGAKG